MAILLMVGAALQWFHVLDPVHEIAHVVVGRAFGGDVRPGHWSSVEVVRGNLPGLLAGHYATLILAAIGAVELRHRKGFAFYLGVIAANTVQGALGTDFQRAWSYGADPALVVSLWLAISFVILAPGCVLFAVALWKPRASAAGGTKRMPLME